MNETEFYPLVNAAQARELYEPSDDPEQTEMQVTIWTTVAGDIARDMRELLATNLPAEDFGRELHRIRGYVLTCAMEGLGTLLKAWELETDSPSAAAKYAPVARRVLGETLDALESAYPHLPPIPREFW